ncbi:hypothetical protein [Ilumatobacter sp.]|uniref:hypothetical protein n=1 Tax=Ilumatobacter sp. TaxID=1967498 RepID=UPI003B528091
MPLATPTRRMPAAEAVREFLSELLAKTVEAAKVDELDLEQHGDAVVSSVLIDDTDAPAGLILSDLAFAAHAGASLIMLPAATALDAVEAGELTETLRENYHEVANIMTGLLNGPSVAHVRIGEHADGLSSDARDVVMKAAGRRTYDVSIPGYGDGRIALYAVGERAVDRPADDGDESTP